MFQFITQKTKSEWKIFKRSNEKYVRDNIDALILFS